MQGTTALATAVSAMLMATVGTVQATLPDDQEISFTLHDTPADPESDIKLKVTLSLTADDSTATDVGWEVTDIKIVKPGSGGDTVWREAYPTIDSADGLWWVEHADTSDPQIAEFVLPPFAEGLAEPDDPQEEDLDYDFVGETYTAPPGGPPYEATAALTYSFVKAASRALVEEGEEEPSESHGVND